VPSLIKAWVISDECDGIDIGSTNCDLAVAMSNVRDHRWIHIHTHESQAGCLPRFLSRSYMLVSHSSARSDSVEFRGIVVEEFLLEFDRPVFHDVPERVDPLREGSS
jgi:hypothetical protein